MCRNDIFFAYHLKNTHILLRIVAELQDDRPENRVVREHIASQGADVGVLLFQLQEERFRNEAIQLPFSYEKLIRGEQ